MLSLVERGRAAMERLNEVLETEPAIAGPANPQPVKKLVKGIEFRDVSFAYTGQKNGHAALEGINFSLPVGRTVGLVGRIGAGKSTLAQLVPRLFDVTSGAILLDGHDIRQLSLTELRQTLGYVPQDPFLFSTSLRRNLTFGREDVSEAELERAVRIARLERDLEIFPQGLSTIVGERGVTLSGGQKQRATLARALVMDPPVLILDDCLSSVDAQTEAEILRGLKSIIKEKTCLIISHRISAVKEADEILVLDEGTANLDERTEEAIAELVAQMTITRVIVAHRPALIRRANRLFHVEGRSIKEISAQRDGAETRATAAQ
jgi:ATP-binding cassette subfamily B protein